MDYTKQIFVNFLNKLISLDKECRSAYEQTAQAINSKKEYEQTAWDDIRQEAQKNAKQMSKSFGVELEQLSQTVDSVSVADIEDKEHIFSRLETCKALVARVGMVSEQLSTAYWKQFHESIPVENNTQLGYSIDDLLSGKIDFDGRLYYTTTSAKKEKDRIEDYVEFNSVCRLANALITTEIEKLQYEIIANNKSLSDSYMSAQNNSFQRIQSLWDSTSLDFAKLGQHYAEQKTRGDSETKAFFNNENADLIERVNSSISSFIKAFPPDELFQEYLRIYSLEPSFDEYECVSEMPRAIHIGSYQYETGNLRLLDNTIAMLHKYYPFLCRKNIISIPHCATFGPDFNYLFRFTESGRTKVVKDGCELGFRLFMMLPPGKLNFTFIDPVRLGESFAMFTRLVDVDDRTSEVINGKIWSAPSDIEDKLKIMTNHISNVTQRCLQGKYKDIYEYNRVAGQNAEAYQILMFMDYPAGLTDQSLKLIEQIVTSGPKCGVFTIIYRNEAQFKKTSERSHPLISNIESSFQKFNYSEDGRFITFTANSAAVKELLWGRIAVPSTQQQDNIIATLKKGIKNAEKVVIGIEQVQHADTTHSTKDGIRIPIGIHGANEVQYLTLGVGGSHHALIAGVAGSGKSSLLHTIILRTLTQYDPSELSVYLVDFKRGVEFKIYADFILPSFKVVAIESEREFGYNILLALEREQKIRADLFKKSHVDKIEEYRELGKSLPRVLVIMDEFHELFSNANDDIAKKSAIIMERIVRQGRAFGVHLILASQSYSNITGIDRAVFAQMAVRVVLKCSKEDANILLDNGSTEIDQISIDDPGRAVYNSEAGNKEYNSHFRVAYIDPSKHRGMLKDISDRTMAFYNPSQPTRILLSNIEDNNYSIFNQFPQYKAERCPIPGKLHIGEPLSVTNDMSMDLMRKEYSNLLMIGNDTEKARSMFAFSILSLCINYWIAHRKPPAKPFIILYNCKPLDDSYFKDTPKLIAEMLPEYVRYISADQVSVIKNTIKELYDSSTGVTEEDNAQYFFVFGYQRADELKSDSKMTQAQDIDSIFNITPNTDTIAQLSAKDMFKAIVKIGSQKGVHTIIWHDSFSALYQDDNSFLSYFNLKIAFDMTQEEYSRFIGANNVTMLNENNAIYYNKARDNQQFRPYQAPDEDWLKEISEKLR